MCKIKKNDNIKYILVKDNMIIKKFPSIKELDIYAKDKYINDYSIIKGLDKIS